MRLLIATNFLLSMVTVMGCCTSGRKDREFGCAHLDSQAIPALVSYHQDIGAFPEMSEGWRVLHEPPGEITEQPKWRGPYLSGCFKETHGKTSLCVLNGTASYISEEERSVARIHLICRKQDEPVSLRVITLAALPHVPRDSLSRHQLLVFSQIEQFRCAISDYRDRHGAYPYDMDEKGSDTKHSTPLLGGYKNPELVRYVRFPGGRGYYLFFFGEGATKYRGYDEFEKLGESQVIVTRSADGKEKLFFAFGDSARK